MNVGDYVRTHGYIDKIININDFREPSMKYALEQPSWNNDVIFIGEEDITKSSPNIIDLIQYDDVLRVLYDNEEYICKVVNVLGNKGVKLTTNLSVSLGCLDIKSIVTKEQFESMEYKVGE